MLMYDKKLVCYSEDINKMYTSYSNFVKNVLQFLCTFSVLAKTHNIFYHTYNKFIKVFYV